MLFLDTGAPHEYAYLGWWKSHALGSYRVAALGLILAAVEVFGLKQSASAQLGLGSLTSKVLRGSDARRLHHSLSSRRFLHPICPLLIMNGLLTSDSSNAPRCFEVCAALMHTRISDDIDARFEQFEKSKSNRDTE